MGGVLYFRIKSAPFFKDLKFKSAHLILGLLIYSWRGRELRDFSLALRWSPAKAGKGKISKLS